MRSHRPRATEVAPVAVAVAVADNAHANAHDNAHDNVKGAEGYGHVQVCETAKSSLVLRFRSPIRSLGTR